jgi:hypothetical protein
MAETTPPKKITLADIRAQGVGGLPIYCSDSIARYFNFFWHKKAPDDAGAQVCFGD